MVKEMRLNGVLDIESANAFAQSFIASWNAKFAVYAQTDEDADRPWTDPEEALDEAMARREERTLSGDLRQCGRPMKRSRGVYRPAAGELDP